jgi:Heterokaryon incompatibility protein (HET)
MSSILPKRVINFGSGTGIQGPFLYESAGEHERYITLSYCWGHQKSFSITRDTKLERKHGSPWSSLPRTFQDAMLVVRKLGVTYLWIDALCIIQDDEEDWQRESGRMASIYGSSYLTVSATRARDVEGGCFASRPTSNEHQYCDETGKNFSVLVRPMLKHDVLRD